MMRSGASAIDWPRLTCSITSRRPSRRRRLATLTVCSKRELNRRGGFDRRLVVRTIQRTKTAVLLCSLRGDF